MKFHRPLTKGKLIKRYKRFLADIELENGEIITAHCTNSGSMKSCIVEGAPVFLTYHNDPRRKTQYTWEMIEINDQWVGINTANPNKLAYEMIQEGKINQLGPFTKLKREVKWGNSRLDLYGLKEDEECFIEVKNVTLKDEEFALFPDAVTFRGKKHLETLMEIKKLGIRAVMLYIIQRMDVLKFAPAKDIDNAYAETLKQAYASGVEVFAVQVEVSPYEIKFHSQLDFHL